MLKTVLTFCVLAMFLAAMAPAAYSDDMKRPGEGGWHHGQRMVKRVDIPITVTGTADNSTAFTLQDMAIEGKKGKVMVITLDKPMTGAYNMTNDMAYVSMGDIDMEGMNIRVDTAKNSTIPVAGASALLGLGGIHVEYKGKDYTIMTFNKLSVYLPDGSVHAYDLDKPVKVIKSKERKMVIWDAYPGFTKALGDSLKGGTTFSADATPLKLTEFEASVLSVTPEKVSDTKPMEAPST